MPRFQKSFFRDLTFLYHRRNFGRNIPATDIDCLEFDRLQPLCLWEAKLKGSKWREGSSTIATQFLLSQQAEIGYFVAEHNTDWSKITVCGLSGLDTSHSKWKPKPVIQSETGYGLQDFVKMLYTLRNRRIEDELQEASATLPIRILRNWREIVPRKLTPINRKQLILELWRELTKKERKELLEIFLQRTLST